MCVPKEVFLTRTQCAVYPFMSARRRQPSDPRALVDINAALRLDAANVEYRVQRILSFVEQQRCSDALHEIHPIVINDSANVWYLYLRLRARAETGDLDGSIGENCNACLLGLWLNHALRSRCSARAHVSCWRSSVAGPTARQGESAPTVSVSTHLWGSGAPVLPHRMHTAA